MTQWLSEIGFQNEDGYYLQLATQNLQQTDGLGSVCHILRSNKAEQNDPSNQMVKVLIFVQRLAQRSNAAEDFRWKQLDQPTLVRTVLLQQAEA